MPDAATAPAPPTGPAAATTTPPSLDEFNSEVESFLEANARRKEAEKKFVWGEGSDTVSMFEERDRDAEGALLAAACEWRAKRFDAGLGWITGPAELGGRGLSSAHQRAYDAARVASTTSPTRASSRSGSAWSRRRSSPTAAPPPRITTCGAMYRGDIVACQLFSEPGAGSDLASLQTKAERDGDEWVITGQKVWTTGAQYSDIGEIIARTDPELPKHKGLTGFIVDMRAPGVEVRPLRQMTGGASFNEVFFNEVKVPDDDRLGDLNNGWNVALTTLMNERSAIGAGGGGGNNLLTRIIAMTKAFGLSDDPLVRQELADLVIRSRVQNMNNQRALDKIRAGQLPGPEMSMAKLGGTMIMRRMGDFVSHVLGPKLIADTGEWGTYAWSQLVLGTPGGRIAGGSDEVMRNIVGERVLGLPKDAGIDSTSPFRDLKVGTQKTPIGHSRRRYSRSRPARSPDVSPDRARTSGNSSGVHASTAGAERRQVGGGDMVVHRCTVVAEREQAQHGDVGPHELGDARPQQLGVAALEQVADQHEHRVARSGHEPPAVAERLGDVGAAAELHAEQHVDRIVQQRREIGDRGVERDEMRAQRRELGEHGAEQRGVHHAVGHRARLVDGDDHVAGEAAAATPVADQPLGHDGAVLGQPVAQVGVHGVGPVDVARPRPS